MATKRGYVMDKELASAVQTVVRQFMASWQPHQIVQRRVKRRGGGGKSDAAIRFGRVTTIISAATGNLQASWGSGSVKVMDDTTGELASNPITVTNPLIGISFVVDSQVELVGTKVINGTCSAVAWS